MPKLRTLLSPKHGSTGWRPPPFLSTSTDPSSLPCLGCDGRSDSNQPWSICSLHLGRQSSKPILLNLGRGKGYREAHRLTSTPLRRPTQQAVQDTRYEGITRSNGATEFYFVSTDGLDLRCIHSKMERWISTTAKDNGERRWGSSPYSITCTAPSVTGST